MSDLLISLSDTAIVLGLTEEDTLKMALAGKIPGAVKDADVWLFNREKLGERSEIASVELLSILAVSSSAEIRLSFKHPFFGELFLPIEDPTALMLMTPKEAGSPPSDSVRRLQEKCGEYLNKKNLQGAYDEMKVFVKQYPLFAFGYGMQGYFAEQLGNLEEASTLTRKAIAIAPSLSRLSDLGRILGKLGKLDESLVVLRFLFHNRTQASSREEAIGFVKNLLVSLMNVKGGGEMVEVAIAAIKDYGPISVFCYQAMLGMMMQGRHNEAWRLFSGVEQQLNPKDPLFPRFQKMKSILMQQLNLA